MQRRFQYRIGGPALWTQLRARREELFGCDLNKAFVSHTDILKARGQEKSKSTLMSRSPSSKTLLHQEKSSAGPWKRERNLGSGSLKRLFQKSIRQFNPTETVVKVKPIGANAHRVYDQTRLACYSTAEEAWRVTSDSLLASIHIRNRIAHENASMESMADEFERISREMREGQVTHDEMKKIHKSIVIAYGYKFADFVFRLSHVAEFVLSKEEQTMHERYQAAYTKRQPIPKDNTHVKEFFDPCHQQLFYYDFRTGQSTWDRPMDSV